MAEKLKFKCFANFDDETQELFCSDPGSPIVDDFGEYYDKDGIYGVRKIGEHDLQAYINSFRDDVDVYKIIARAGAGDLSALNRVPGSYFDLTSLPDNVHEACQVMNEAQLFFSKLPSDVRVQYANNFRQFISDYGSERFYSIFKPSDPVSSPNSESGSSAAENLNKE